MDQTDQLPGAGTLRTIISASGDPVVGPAPHISARLIGTSAIVFSTLYLLSDVLEVVQGDFTEVRLVMTYAGESTLPLFVLGLYSVQRPFIGRLGLVGAVAYAYAYAYVFFTSTVVYALVAGTRNYDDLATRFGASMIVHGAVLVLGGVAFGAAVVRAGVLPRWTGFCLIAGVIAVAAVSGLPTVARTLAAALPAAAFIGMGCALLTQGVRQGRVGSRRESSHEGRSLAGRSLPHPQLVRSNATVDPCDEVAPVRIAERQTLVLDIDQGRRPGPGRAGQTPEPDGGRTVRRARRAATGTVVPQPQQRGTETERGRASHRGGGSVLIRGSGMDRHGDVPQG